VVAGHDARAPAGAHAHHMEDTGCRIVIELSQGEPEPKGELSVAGALERPFAGWIGLISALEAAVEGIAAPRPERVKDAGPCG
jgi:hypothetical protein